MTSQEPGNTSTQEASEQPAQDFTNSWRYRFGLGLFIFGQVVLVLGLLSPLLGIGAGTATVIVVGAEVVSLTSIVFLGKEGFLAIKAKVFGFLKAIFAAQVGRTRHYIGIALLCTNVVTTYVLMFYAWTGFKATTRRSGRSAGASRISGTEFRWVAMLRRHRRRLGHAD